MERLRDSKAVFARYEALRSRLPEFPDGRDRPPIVVDDLSAAFDRFDVFVLDGFGVLNVGGAAIEGAAQRVAEMRAAGKRVIVLTNSATFPTIAGVSKYRGLGFDFDASEIVSSRDVAETAMAQMPQGLVWGATAAGPASIADLSAHALEDAGQPYEAADAFLYLSGDEWNEARQARLVEALKARPRRVVVANPDLVAPRETGLTTEPGAWAHALLDELPSLDLSFHGKPLANAFDAVMERLGPNAPPSARIAMVGDTLHTDILGGAAAGWGTILVTAHGILKGLDPNPFIDASGIVPDIVAHTT
ncbi:MAG: HAD hydrolase-like protein [Pseudomonadota bacterium]